MSAQRGDVLEEDVLLARGAVGAVLLAVLVLLPEVHRELVGVEEGVAAQVAGEDAPLVTLDQVSPHLVVGLFSGVVR